MYIREGFVVESDGGIAGAENDLMNSLDGK
jgi:hypothetical protein